MSIHMVKPVSRAERHTRTTTDTILVTPETVGSWRRPHFQREVTVNAKVKKLTQEVAQTRVIPGVLTLGVFRGVTYIIDGQHRVRSFILAGIPEGYVDVRTLYVDTEEEMAEEFLRLNTALVRLRPDDGLRALEDALPALKTIKERCSFVGYDRVRRNVASAPLLSMSVVTRVWSASMAEIPSARGDSARDMAEALSLQEAEYCASFLNTAMKAWGRDKSYLRLWGALNLTMCAWLYRRLVLGPFTTPKVMRIDGPTFCKCLMSLSAKPAYLEWLQGRLMGDADRGPAYRRIKMIFLTRLRNETGPNAPTKGKAGLPQPEWCPQGGSGHDLRGIVET